MTAEQASPAARHRWPAWVRLAIAFVLVAVVGVATVVILTGGPRTASPAARPLPLDTTPAQAGVAGDPGPGGNPDHRTLILYDEATAGDENAASAEAYAMFTANLASRAGAWDLRPAHTYRTGDLAGYQAVIYVGSLQNARLPAAMPRDLAATDLPVLWLGNNIERYERVAGELGWRTTGLRADRPTTVTYKGMALSRDPADTTPVHAVTVEDENRTQVLAHTSGREPQSPWAVRTDAFTYVAEVPYAYLDSGGRYLAAADVLLGTLEPEAPTRHRALVRIEDVGPDTDVDDLRPIVELLVEEDVPFSVAVYPYFTDPRGVTADGEPQSARLVDEPELVDLLRYATEHGGTLVMHGYTHQYEKASNPRSAVSGDDYEFYRSTVDDDGHVALHGPVPADSAEWFRDRVATGLAEFRRVGLPTPTLWEFPHYGGSAVDYHETNGIFAGRYDRGSYYAGYCPGGRCGAAEDVSYDEVYGQHFPYPVRDVYGTNVVPENIGNLAPSKFNQYSARTVVDMLADAQRSLVVRDNVASFFYHPFLGTAGLRDLVSSLQSLGYTFASPDDILDDRTPR